MLASAIKDILETINGSIEHATKQIELMREYRTRLISDVVTGKFDVREAAANLPDEEVEAEPFDDTEAVTDEEAIEELDEELIDAD